MEEYTFTNTLKRLPPDEQRKVTTRALANMNISKGEALIKRLFEKQDKLPDGSTIRNARFSGGRICC